MKIILTMKKICDIIPIEKTYFLSIDKELKMNRNTDTAACAGLCPCVSPCPIGRALAVIGGKWKMRIVCTLYVDGTQRYNDLVRKTSGVTNAMLSSSLKELEADNAPAV